MNLLFINWNVDPVFFTLFGFQVRYYGILFAIAFVASYWAFTRMYKFEGIKIEEIDNLAFYVGIGVVVGARLGHVLFYQPEYYFSHPWHILNIREGGLASHGAAIGIVIALGLYSRKYKRPFIWLLDRITLAVAIAGMFVRLGNLMNSEIYGHVTNLPWGFVFLREGEMLPKHPTQIYEALAYLMIFFVLYWLHFKKEIPFKKPGMQFGIFLILLFSARFFVEFIKNDQVGFEQTMALNMGQILSIPFILAGICFIIYANKYAKPYSRPQDSKRK
jgi:phosphatidylglycerol:prolipoprotein diacylglycerol transferase